MIKTFVLFKTMLKYQWYMYKRYFFNFISFMASMYLLFILVFWGLSYYIPAISIGDTIEGMMIGLLMWIAAIWGMSNLTWALMENAREGTLEQLAMSQFGLGKVQIFRMIADYCLSFLFLIPFLFLMMASSKRWLYMDIFSILPLFVLTISSACGIGFILGGLAIIYKKVQSCFQLIEFGLLGCIALSGTENMIIYFLPFSLGVKLLGRTMIQGESILSFLPEMGILLMNSIVYLLIGYKIFNICINFARVKGSLSHY